MHWSEAEYHAYLTRQHLPCTIAPTAPTDRPEADLMGQVRALARRHGWLCSHTHNSLGSDEGFPDLVLVGPERIIFAELKTRVGNSPSGKRCGSTCSATRAKSKSISGGRGIGPRWSPVWAGPRRERYTLL